MKNIHVLPTDKPSNLIHNVLGYGIISDEFIKSDLEQDFILKHVELIQAEFQNIYITNDEDIKEGDWYYDDFIKQIIIADNKPIGNDCKKIILTTDVDLIKDGVQAIDDEFLQWFVKNPSCEFVEVEKGKILNQGSYITGNIVTKDYYEIIIPKEEPTPVWKQIIESCGGEEEFMESAGLKPKKETLEEAADKFVKDWFLTGDKTTEVFKAGAKWQAERMYSEEEVLKLLLNSEEYTSRFNGRTDLRSWFEQFKKK
jgi:hypothetical protein